MAKTEVTIEVDGIEELQENIKRMSDNILRSGHRVIDEIAYRIAGNIREKYTGRVGFKDRTGALRNSIQGGIVEAFGGVSEDPVGVVRAGDDTIGSQGKQTADYVTYVEFGELYGHDQTSFLRPGVMESHGIILTEVAQAMNPDVLIKDTISGPSKLGRGERAMLRSPKLSKAERQFIGVENSKGAGI